MQRGDGRCELCHTEFRFAPQYDNDAPERLPASQVVLSLMRQFFSRWLPVLIRCVFAASLWLLVAPLLTAYVYHAWMHQPSVVWDRCSDWSLIPGDMVSGAVLVGVIIVSFLSIMSFIDFLRVEWHPDGRPRPRWGEEGPEPAVGEAPAPDENAIDNAVWDAFQRQVVERHRRQRGRAVPQRVEHELLQAHAPGQPRTEERFSNENVELDASGSDSESSWQDDDDRDDDDDTVSDDEWIENVEEDDDSVNDDNDRDEPQLHPPAVPIVDDRDDGDENPQAFGRNNFDMDPDDGMDMDINIALDELLGARGPITSVVRNLLWLLAFNTVYLGFFGFTPKVLGTITSTIFRNTTVWSPMVFTIVTNAPVPDDTQIANESLSIWTAYRAIESESASANTTFRLHDLFLVLLGYASCAGMVVLIRFLWLASQKIRALRSGRADNPVPLRELQEGFEEMNRIMRMGPEQMNMVDDNVAIHVFLTTTLDATLAITKVGVLLFMKMFLLPIWLGLCLDVSSLPILGSSFEERIAYAGKDLFSFLLLHWVVGITFMLLVTVSVLQLREVVHPELLAQTIRPQEPQPDLLGNLMNESIITHMKRMVLSLVIYVVLLAMYIYLPIQAIMASGVSADLSMAQLKFWYPIMPELQVPLELLTFHLCMLALLEKHKNSIGEIQHYWLKFISRLVGLTDSLIPMRVDCFEYVGVLPIFEHEAVSPFWSKLAKNENEREKLLDESVATFLKSDIPRVNIGQSKANGQRVLASKDYVRLPDVLPGRLLRSRSVLMPTTIGKYRLQRILSLDGTPLIEIWKEERGTPIARPPEGWDDLGAGGADVQGRWAWGREKKSVVEEAIAHRVDFFGRNKASVSYWAVWVKLIFMFFSAWLSTTCFICISLICPLAFGRTLYHILQVPQAYVHDPLAFVVGCLIFFPVARCIGRWSLSGENSLMQRLFSWLRSYRRPPSAKARLLLVTAITCFGLAPVLLGFIYHALLVKLPPFFAGTQEWIALSLFSSYWATGFVLLFAWARLCIAEAFTKKFWKGLMGAAGDVDDNEGNVQNSLRWAWQGKEGRVSRFTKCWRKVVLTWEFDQVDLNTLVDDVATPVITALARVVVPYCIFMMLIVRTFGLDQVTVATFGRIALGLLCAEGVSRTWRIQFSNWLEAAHQMARDDRYLIGEMLMNYDG